MDEYGLNGVWNWACTNDVLNPSIPSPSLIVRRNCGAQRSPWTILAMVGESLWWSPMGVRIKRFSSDFKMISKWFQDDFKMISMSWVQSCNQNILDLFHSSTHGWRMCLLRSLWDMPKGGGSSFPTDLGQCISLSVSFEKRRCHDVLTERRFVHVFFSRFLPQGARRSFEWTNSEFGDFLEELGDLAWSGAR